MESAGLWMLGSVGVLILATGLPAFVVLIAVSAGFAAWGVITGILPAGLLTASCPGRYACCLAISVPVDGGSIPLAALCGCQLRVGPLVLGCAPSVIASCN